MGAAAGDLEEPLVAAARRPDYGAAKATRAGPSDKKRARADRARAARHGAYAAGLLVAAGCAAYALSRPAAAAAPRAAADAPFASVVVAKAYYMNCEADADRRRALEAGFRATAPDLAVERVPAVEAASADDLAGELGDYVVDAYGCADACANATNRGLCCLGRLGDGRAAADAVDPDYGCGHFTVSETALGAYDESHKTCFAELANWASHLKALDRAAAAFGTASDDVHVLILEDDARAPPGWPAALAKAAFAPAGSPDAAAATTRDPTAYDYVRLDARNQRDDSRTADLAGPEDFVNGPLEGTPLYAAGGAFERTLAWDAAAARFVPGPETPRGGARFLWGAGALLVRANRAAKVRASLATAYREPDVALNVGTWLGEIQLATLAAPVLGNTGADTTLR